MNEEYELLVEENGKSILSYLQDDNFCNIINTLLEKKIPPEHVLRFFRNKGVENMIFIRAVEVYLQCKGLLKRTR